MKLLAASAGQPPKGGNRYQCSRESAQHGTSVGQEEANYPARSRGSIRRCLATQKRPRKQGGRETRHRHGAPRGCSR